MQFVIAALVAVYFVFFLSISVTDEFIDKLARFTAAEWIALAFLPALLLVLPYISKHYKHGRLSGKETFWVSIIIATYLFLTTCLVVNDRNSTIVLSAGYLATLGWLYTNYTNINNQRKAHTMNVLIQMRNSSEFQKHRLNVSARLPLGTPLTKETMDALVEARTKTESYENGKIPTIDSIVYILNYYEFISVGVEAGDLDGSMIKLTLRSIFVTFHDHVSPYVDRTKNLNPRAYMSYVNLVKEYRAS